jgi:hypothetical protein
MASRILFISVLEPLMANINSETTEPRMTLIKILPAVVLIYFPIQKLAKILPNNSSLLTLPVISPK